jgi:hypothetical protein
MEIVHTSSGYIDECRFVPWLRGLLLHGKKSFLANPSNPAILKITFKELANYLSATYWMFQNPKA